ncbi:MAG: hypothetical protein E4H46_01335 [Desulfobacterales bacterium]|nr:MAG: hypothetical protein E4H46_01335 [Desulfobacterales bacterium]
MFIVAISFAIVAVGIWFVFLRPVPLQKATGTITHKIFKPAGEHWQYPVGLNRDFLLPTKIPIAESYIFGIQIDGSGQAAVGYALNTVASKEFEVGNRVQIEYQERGIPLLWKRLYVLDMRPIK